MTTQVNSTVLSSLSNITVANTATIGAVASPLIGNVGSTHYGTTANITGNVTVGANVKFTGWQIYEQATTLYFAYNGVNKMSLTTAGNLTVVGDVAGFGTP